MKAPCFVEGNEKYNIGTVKQVSKNIFENKFATGGIVGETAKEGMFILRMRSANFIHIPGNMLFSTATRLTSARESL